MIATQTMIRKIMTPVGLFGVKRSAPDAGVSVPAGGEGGAREDVQSLTPADSNRVPKQRVGLSCCHDPATSMLWQHHGEVLGQYGPTTPHSLTGVGPNDIGADGGMLNHAPPHQPPVKAAQPSRAPRPGSRPFSFVANL